jgi:hypothetical protein
MPRFASGSAYTRYLRLLLLIALPLLALVALFNLIVDPAQVYRVFSWGNKVVFKSSLGTRVAKAEAVRRPPWDIVLLGSSRTDSGLAPTIPAWDNHHVYNCGLTGTDMEELLQATRLALQNSDLRQLYLCTDLEDFDPNRDPQDDFSQSLFNTQINPLEYHIAGLLGMAATDQSLQSLRNLRTGHIGEHTPEGLLARPTRRLTLTEWQAYARDLVGRLGITRLRVDQRRLGAGGTISPQRFQNFDEILDLAAQHHIPITVVILPGHIVWLECIHAANKWDLFESWNRQLVSHVAAHNQKHPDQPVTIWCFKQYLPFTEEPLPPLGQPSEMVWYRDPVHFTVDLGNLVTDRLTNHFSHKYHDYPQVNDFGVHLTPDTVDAYLSQLKKDREAFVAKTPWITEFMQAATGDVAPVKPKPE